MCVCGRMWCPVDGWASAAGNRHANTCVYLYCAASFHTLRAPSTFLLVARIECWRTATARLGVPGTIDGHDSDTQVLS